MANQAYRIHIRQGEFELDVEGDRAFVEAYVEAFLAEEEELEHGAEGHHHHAAPRKAARKAGPRPAKSAVAEVDLEALSAFMEGKATASNKERYLRYMGFWRTQGAEEVGDAQIQACFAAEGLPLPPTGRQNFGALRKEGLVQGGAKRGFWTLTPAGEERATAQSGAAKHRKPARRPRKAKAAASGKRPARKAKARAGRRRKISA